MNKELPDYIEVADKIYEVVKVENALQHLLKNLKNKGVIN